jgi:hypothetical protein
MDLLHKHFVSTWSLTTDLEALKKDKSNRHSRLARQIMDVYQFPVMMLVALPNGTVIHAINANELLDISEATTQDHEPSPSFLDTGFEDPSGVSYATFLKEGMEKAKNALNEIILESNKKVEL